MKKPFYTFILLVICLACSAQAIEQSLLFKLLEIRRESYLQKPGEITLDITPYYVQDKALVPWSIIKSYSYNVNTSLRLGISHRLELSLKIPYSATFRETWVGSWESFHGSGAGDPSLSFQYEIIQEKYNRPAVYLIGGLTMPTAKSYLDKIAANEIPIGLGHYSTNWGLTFLKSLDPCVAYWGGEYRWIIKRENYDPADLLTIYGGVGWSLNQQVNISLAFNDTIAGEDKLITDGAEKVVSSAYNQASLCLGSTFIINPKFYINPSIILGMSDEESDYTFSLGFSFVK